MKLGTIKAIFTDILFLLGVILLMLGTASGFTTAAKLALFTQYPLPPAEERSCDYSGMSDGEIMPRETKNDCLRSLEISRKVSLTEDVVNSVTLISTGVILVLAFRNFLVGDTHLVRLFPKFRSAHHKKP